MPLVHDYARQPLMQTTTPPSSGEQLWKQCLQIIAGSCDPQTLQRWFAPIRPLGIETREDEQGRFKALVLLGLSCYGMRRLSTRWFCP